MRDLALGLDLGSSALKGLLLARDGEIAARAERAISTQYPAAGQVEQRPEDWLDALGEVVWALLAAAGPGAASRIAGLGVCGAAHIPVLLGADFEPLRPAVMWSDLRSADEAAEVRDAHDVLATCFNESGPGWTLPQLRWLHRYEPETFCRVRHILFGKDLIVHHLTGRLVTDEGNAASTLLMEARTARWHPPLVDLSRLDAAMLPAIARPGEVVGRLSAERAPALGLEAGLPVIAGGLDSVMELLSLGITRPGEAMLRMGTAGGIMSVAAEPRPNAGLITYPYLRGDWCAQAFTSCCTSALQWLRRLLATGGEVARSGAGEGDDPMLPLERVDEMARAVAPGADGLVFHPYLLGERAPLWDPQMRASFTGLAMHHGRAHFVRAVLEGVAFSMHDCLDALRTAGYPVDLLMATGGGTRSDLWVRIVSDVLGVAVSRMRPEGSALGVAMLAGASAGLFDGLEGAVAASVRQLDVIRPEDAAHRRYRPHFERYRALRDALQPVYRRDT